MQFVSRAGPWGFAIGAVLLWSTVATAFKIALQWVSPLQLVFLASLVSTFAIASILILRGRPADISPKHFPGLRTALVRGLMNPLLYYLVLFEAYDRLRAQEAMAINYSWPAMLVLLSALFLGQSIRARQWLALIVAYAGVLVIATRGDLLAWQVTDVWGVSLALCSTLIWATYWIGGLRQPGDPIRAMFFGFLLATPLLGLAVWWIDPIDQLAWQGWAAALYVGLFEMGITFVLWNTALHRAAASDCFARVSAIIYFTPFLSLVLIGLVLGEAIHASALVGLVLVVAGMWLSRPTTAVSQT